MKRQRYGEAEFPFAQQRTLKTAIHCSGTGLHTGARVAMVLRPADSDTGIVFRRTDVRGGVEIPASWRYVTDTCMCTTIGDGNGVSIATVEHLLAALSGCGIDNALVEIDGPEVPIMDGSAEPFVFLIECAGVVAQDAPKQAIKIQKPLSVTEGDRIASLAPNQHFSISFEIEFDNPVVARQVCNFRSVNGTFKSEISRARTFGFLEDVGRLRAAGLARGGSLDNAVVVGQDCVLNTEGLRYEDEFVRHKVLDTIGDLYLAGAPIIGHFDGFRSGHGLNRRLLEALFADDAAWCYTLFDGAAAADEEWGEDALRASA